MKWWQSALRYVGLKALEWAGYELKQQAAKKKR